MTWVTFRDYTKADEAKLNEVALRFAKRHDLTSEVDEVAKWEPSASYWSRLDYILNWSIIGDDYLRVYWKGLWGRCFGRAVGIPSARGVAYGKIGHSL